MRQNYVFSHRAGLWQSQSLGLLFFLKIITVMRLLEREYNGGNCSKILPFVQVESQVLVQSTRVEQYRCSDTAAYLCF